MPAPFTDLIGTDSFTETLRQENLDTWLSATNHRFVAELFDGSIAPQVMAGYLVQDYRFLDTFLALIGGAIANADTLAGRLRLAQFAGEIAGDENTYFLRCFETLGVTEHQRDSMPDTEATTGFKRLFLDAAASGSYAAILSVLVVCEGLYLDWASKAPAKRPESFVHHEWISLHDYRSSVSWLISCAANWTVWARRMRSVPASSLAARWSWSSCSLMSRTPTRCPR